MDRWDPRSAIPTTSAQSTAATTRAQHAMLAWQLGARRLAFPLREALRRVLTVQPTHPNCGLPKPKGSGDATFGATHPPTTWRAACDELDRGR